MAQDEGSGGSPSETPVDTKVAHTPTTTITMGDPLGGKPQARHSRGEATTYEGGEGDVSVRTGLGPDGGDEGERTDPPPTGDDPEAEGGELPPEGGSEGDDPDAEQQEEQEEETSEDLGDYDPNDEESVARFQQEYFKDDGDTLDMERLSKEWWANQATAEDGTGKLNDATYKFLQDELGVSQEDIKAIEAGQQALHQNASTALHERVGGKERLDAMINWGKGGGYTEAQQTRFNEIMASGDQEAINDALDALAVRYDRANQDAPQAEGGPRRRGRRPNNPSRDATATAPRRDGAGQGYESYQQYREEFRAAVRDKDPDKQAAVRRKLRQSDFYRNRPKG